MGEWGRARLAYADLLGDDDPAAEVLMAGDVADVRPGGLDHAGDIAVVTVVSGPGDLAELRTIVESITGAGTWPLPPPVDGEVRRATIELPGPGPVLRLVASMEGLVADRGGMWRTWRTTMELIAARVADLPELTVEAAVISR